MLETDLFKQLSDATRLRCLMLLIAEGELCVCELTHALGLSQPKISRHLAHLRQADLVQDRRVGQWIHYRLHDNLPGWVRAVLDATATELNRRSEYVADRQNLCSMPNRPGSACCA